MTYSADLIITSGPFDKLIYKLKYFLDLRHVTICSSIAKIDAWLLYILTNIF